MRRDTTMNLQPNSLARTLTVKPLTMSLILASVVTLGAGDVWPFVAGQGH